MTAPSTVNEPKPATPRSDGADPTRTLSSRGRNRVFLEKPTPAVDGGAYAVKCCVGDVLVVEVDLVSDGHDVVAGRAIVQDPTGARREAPLTLVENDRYRATFSLDRVGRHRYTAEAWVDRFATLRRGIGKKLEAGVELGVDLLVLAAWLGRARDRATSRGAAADAQALNAAHAKLADERVPADERARMTQDGELAALAARHPDDADATRLEPWIPVTADRTRARFSAWYELFPRSYGDDGRHGTFADAERVLPYVASMGFDVLYLPPIHPIGRAHRKGKNNALVAGEGEPGSPWAVGGEGGGHTSIHPELGTFADFRRFRDAAADLGLELALDVAFQASPDHPWVREHPEWFERRPDGTIQYAENPPKKYQDIYPFDFDSADWQGLWRALYGVFEFWIAEGVRIFRVDNPHTKSLRFWQWCCDRLAHEHPDVILLAEAFTRPKLMYLLAKLGFAQSYTYFTWRTTPAEMTAYLRELTTTEVVDFFRPCFWPNTPDILPEHLQYAGRPSFVSRFVLAATLSGNYGIYGPAFELMEHVPRAGVEEYVDNEKYELKRWDLSRADSLRPFITLLNEARRAHPALADHRSLSFHPTDNPHLLCYSKRSEDGRDVVIVVVSFDPHAVQSGFVHLDLAVLGVPPYARFEVHDVLSDERYTWHGARSYVRLDPHVCPAHLFVVRVLD